MVPRSALALLSVIACAGCGAEVVGNRVGEPDLYDLDTLRSFRLTFSSADWYEALKRARNAGSYLAGDLEVDGRMYRNVGVRFRGTSSYLTGSSTKKPVNISMSEFEGDQELMGYDSLNLSNSYNDPTLCREVLSYAILRRYVPAPKANYVKLYVNGLYWGLYVNVQQVDRRMIREWFADGSGSRYRCDPSRSSGDGKSALQWLGQDLRSYAAAYQIKTGGAANRALEELRHLCDVLNNCNPDQLDTELPRVLDVDEALWYLAINNVMLNLDSYLIRGNDYFLYRDPRHGTMSVLPWDMNESFGGFLADMSVDECLRLSIFHNADNPDRPLLARLLAQPEWRARYVHHVVTVVDECFHWGFVGPMVARLQESISRAVRGDKRKLHGFDAFQANVTTDVHIGKVTVPGLRRVVDGRYAYITSLREYVAPRPAISEVAAHPGAGGALTVTARVENTVPIDSLMLYYRGIGEWRAVSMTDDGSHDDGPAGDGLFGASIPADCLRPGWEVHYYVGAQSVGTRGGGVSYEPAHASLRPLRYLEMPQPSVLSVRINEVLARNTRGITDENGEREDWLELYNASQRPVVVGGMYLTDDAADPRKWRIPPGLEIPAGEALVIWCDDEPDGPLHAAFKLGSSGETVLLYASDGETLLSALTYAELGADASRGWSAEGDRLVTFEDPTPGRPNPVR